MSVCVYIFSGRWLKWILCLKILVIMLVTGASYLDQVVRCSSTRFNVPDYKSLSRAQYSTFSTETFQFRGRILELPISGLTTALTDNREDDWGLHRPHWQHQSEQRWYKRGNEAETTQLQQQIAAPRIQERSQLLNVIGEISDNTGVFCNKGVAPVPATLHFYNDDSALRGDIPGSVRLASYKKPNYRRSVSVIGNRKSGPMKWLYSLTADQTAYHVTMKSFDSPDGNQVFWLKTCHEQLNCELKTPTT